MAVGDVIRFSSIGESEPPEPVKPKPPRYILGLDLGQRADYSALCLLETNGEAENAVSHCRT